MAYRNPAKIFDSAVSASNLQRTYYDHVIDGGGRGRDGMSPQALEADLVVVTRRLSVKVKTGQHRFIQYKEMTHSKGAGKYPRVISVPAVRDRILFRTLASFLAEVFPEAVMALPQESVRKVAEEVDVSRYDSYVRLDVRDFYPSISHSLVEAELRRRIRRTEIVRLFIDAIATPTVPLGFAARSRETVGVPQGLAISNYLAELAMRPIDKYFSGSTEFQYFRYVDDILILCDSGDVEALDARVRSEIEGRGFQVHERGQAGNKSCVGLTKDGFSYLGYDFEPGLISVRKTSVRNLEARLAAEFTKYRHAPESRKRYALQSCRGRVNLAITGCTFQGRPSGWLPYYRQMTDLTLLKELDATVQSMISRFRMPRHFKVKSFMRAYWALAHPNSSNSNYFPRLDGLSKRQMRIELEKILGADKASDLTDDQVPRVFRRTLSRIISEFEQDIANRS